MTSEQALGAQLFNQTWELIDKPDRTPDDDADMLSAALASRWHWAKAEGATAENFAMSDWQVAHVASLLGHGSLAVQFATRALAVADAEGWDDWRRASMLEGMARACAAAGDAAGRARFHAEATAAISAIKDPEDRVLIASQLATVPELKKPPEGP